MSHPRPRMLAHTGMTPPRRGLPGRVCLHPRPARLPRVLGLALLLLTIPGRGLLGQARPGSTMPEIITRPPPHVDPRWHGHAIAFGTNAVIGGVVAGVAQTVRGESFLDGFARGAAGGGLAYTGKYLGSRTFPAAGLIGRQTTALGASITRNAVDGGSLLESLSFPLGPVRIHRRAMGPRITVDLPTVAGTIFALTRPGARFDLGRSVATGALVFEAHEVRSEGPDRTILGTAIGGMILHRRNEYADDLPLIMAHETVHVLQHDYAMTAWSDPFEGWLARKAPPRLAPTLRRLDFGSYASLRLLVRAVGITGRDTPWEQEAYFLAHKAPPPPLTGVPDIPAGKW